MLTPELGSTGFSPPLAESPRRPRIAIVVTCTHDVDTLHACLVRIEATCLAARAEVLVVSAKSAPELRDVIREFPTLTYITAPNGTLASQLRRIGLLRTASNIIAFVDDFAVERHSWTADLCRSWREWIGTGGRVAGPLGESMRAAPHPALSVVMPVRNGGETLLNALEGLSLSDLPRETWELVVVDDSSTDATAAIAAQYADKMVRLPGRPHGPGYARNRGFEVTLGDYITFVNADVMVHADTLRCSATALMADSSIGAVFGCYDANPLAKGLVSQYRNLLQHYYLQCNKGDAATFSSACGTIRSSVFQEAGAYDEWHFPRRQLEDLELGQRVRGLGHRIVLPPNIRVTNLKRWTLSRMLRTEIFDRAVPWMRLVNRHFMPPKATGRTLRSIKRVNTALTWLAVGLLLVSWSTRLPVIAIGAAVCVLVVAANDRALLSFFRRERGLAFAGATVVLGIINYVAAGLGVALGWIARQTVGEPRPGPTAEAFTEMAVKGWPPVPVKRLVDRAVSVTDEAPTIEVALPPHRRPTPPGLLALGEEGTV